MKCVDMNRNSQRHVMVARWSGLFSMALGLGVLMAGVSEAGGFRSPLECQDSTDEAHLTCLYEYIGIQDEPSGNIEPKSSAEQEMLEQLREQRDQVEARPGPATERPQDRRDRSQTRAAVVVQSPSVIPISPSFRSPDECRAYTGAAHLNCLYAYIEIQQSKAGKIEEELRVPREMLGQLRDQVDRQTSTRDDLERQLTERPSLTTPATIYTPPPIYPGYVYPGYAYPPAGFSLYLGLPGLYYGRPFYGPRFYGPRFFGPRFYGPRYYSPRFFGHRH